MNERELENLGEKVRVQGGQGSGTMSELVFDPVTGEFRTIEPGEDCIFRGIPVHFLAAY